MTLAPAFSFTGLVILAIWNVPEATKWFGFIVSYSAVTVSSVLYGWANIILKNNIEEKALTFVLMSAIATSTNAWVSATVRSPLGYLGISPCFPKGYVYLA